MEASVTMMSFRGGIDGVVGEVIISVPGVERRHAVNSLNDAYPRSLKCYDGWVVKERSSMQEYMVWYKNRSDDSGPL